MASTETTKESEPTGKHPDLANQTNHSNSENNSNNADSNNNTTSGADMDNIESISNEDDDHLESLVVGCKVHVECRTWPGINKQGGPAIVTSVDRDQRCVDVKYILESRREKKVDIEFITLAHELNEGSSQLQSTILRDRSNMLGRCTRCGSLRFDCGSCDFRADESEDSAVVRRAPRKRRASHSDNANPNVTCQSDDDAEEGNNEYEDSTDDELENVLRECRRKRNKINHDLEMQRKDQEAESKKAKREAASARAHARRVRNENNSSSTSLGEISEEKDEKIHLSSSDDEGSSYSTSSSEDDDDIPLSNLVQFTGPTKKEMRQRLKEKYQQPCLQRKKGKRDLAEKRKRYGRSGPISVLETIPEHGHSVRNKQAYAMSTEKLANSNNERDEEKENWSDTFSVDLDNDENDEKRDHDQDANGTESDDEDPAAFGNDDAENGDTDENMFEEEKSSDAVLMRTQRKSKRGFFIQPEGQKAAENLPEDIKDRASEVDYIELPNFFSGEATKIEDELIPDAKLQIAKLDKKFKDWETTQSAATFHSSTERQGNTLLVEFEKASEDICQKLIRDGVDQCRSAMKQLTSRSRYRRERNNLTGQQRKELRDDNRLFLMDTRLEKLERRANALYQKILGMTKTLADLIEKVNGSSKEQNISSSYPGSSNDDIALAELPPQEPHESSNRGHEAQFASWHRHRYASTKRNHEGQAQVSAARGIAGQRKRQRTHEQSRYSSSCESLSRASTANHHRPNGSGDRVSSHAKRPSSRQVGTSTVENQILRSKSTNARVPQTRRDICGHQGTPEAKATQNYFLRDVPSSENSRSEGRQKLSSNRDDSKIPSLDELLSSTDIVGGFKMPAVKEHQMSRRGCTGMKEKMEAFLKANEMNIDDLEYGVQNEFTTSARNNQVECSFIDKSKPTGQRRRQPRRFQGNDTSRKQQNWLTARNASRDPTAEPRKNGRKVHDGNSGCTTSVSMGIMGPEVLFANMKKAQLYLVETHDPLIGPAATCDEDFERICENVICDCRRGVSRMAEDQLKTIVSTAISTQNHKTASRSFRTLLTMLQTHGSTLQEVMTKQNAPHFQCHVTLLSCIISLVQHGMHVYLRDDDGMAFQLFSNGAHKVFVKLIVLQLVDSLYSIFHPTAWASPFDSAFSQILDGLVPLREALARVVPLTESVCNCLVLQLESQQWRIVNTPNPHAFVSSVDPTSWRLFIQEGKVPPRPKASRLSSFTSQLPRCEIDALWSLFAFVASSANNIPSNSDVCWRLTNKLLLKGCLLRNLGTHHEAEKLPVSQSQLDSCRKELDFLSFALLHGVSYDKLKKDDAAFEIVQRTTQLQAAYYASNDHSRHLCFPSFRDTRVDAAAVRKIWNAFPSDRDIKILHPSGTPEESENLALEVASGSKEALFCGQPMLLPSSALARQSLKLIFVWIQKVILTKIRMKRLMKTMGETIDTLVEEAKQRDSPGRGVQKSSKDEKSSVDCFAKSFPMPVTQGMDKGLHLLEVAAYMHVVAKAALCARGGDMFGGTSWLEATKQVWKILADGEMQSRLDKPSSQSHSYKGIVLRPYITAKILTFAALSMQGVQTWKRKGFDQVTGAVLLPSEAPSQESLVFVVKCLVTCLDCISECDKADSIRSMACVSFYIAHILCHACRLLRLAASNSELQLFVPSIAALGKVANTTLSSTFKKCFIKIAESESVKNEESDICLRSLLAALRGSMFLELSAMDRVGINDSLQRNSEASTDHHSICGDTDSNENPNSDAGTNDGVALQANSSEAMFHLLDHALQHSKPSQKFALSRTNVIESSLSVQGKNLVARNRRHMCDCLALLICFQIRNPKEQCLRSFPVWSASDPDDAAYKREVSQLTFVELCRVVGYFPTETFVVKTYKNGILLSVVDALLDVSSLERLPTGSKSRMLEIGGNSARDEELNLIEVLDGFRQRGKLLRHAARFCADFGAALNDGEDEIWKRVGLLLSNTQKSVSLEEECLWCIKTLTSVAITLFETNIEEYERLSMHIMATFSRQVLTLSSELGKVKLAAPTSYRHAKLTVLLSAYGEVHAALFCWFFRSSHQVHSKTYEQVIQNVLEPYLSSIFVGNETSVYQKLKELANASSDSCPGQAVAPKPSAAMTNVVDVLRDSFLRKIDILLEREAELVRTTNSGGRILSTIVSLCIGNGHRCDETLTSTAARLVATALCPGADDNAQPKDFDRAPTLKEVVDRYLQTLNSERRIKDRKKLLWTLQHKVLVEHLIPRFFRQIAAAEVSMPLVCFVQNIIGSGEGSTFGFNLDEVSRVSTLKCLSGVLTLAMRVILEAPVFDGDLAGAILSCARSLAESNIGGTRQNVAEWSQSSSSQVIAETSLSFSETDVALYVWHALLWIKDVAELFVNEFNLNTIRGISRKLKDNKNKWPPLTSDKEALLSQVTNRMFPQYGKNAVVNVYLKRKGPQPTKQDSVPGRTPSLKTIATLRREAKHFLAEILPLC